MRISDWIQTCALPIFARLAAGLDDRQRAAELLLVGRQHLLFGQLRPARGHRSPRLLSLGQDDHRIQPAAGLVEARVRRDLGDVDVAVAEAVAGADVVVGVGLQAVALHLPGDVAEGALKRLARTREESDQARASRPDLAGPPT